MEKRAEELFQGLNFSAPFFRTTPMERTVTPAAARKVHHEVTGNKLPQNIESDLSPAKSQVRRKSKLCTKSKLTKSRSVNKIVGSKSTGGPKTQTVSKSRAAVTQSQLIPRRRIINVIVPKRRTAKSNRATKKRISRQRHNTPVSKENLKPQQGANVQEDLILQEDSKMQEDNNLKEDSYLQESPMLQENNKLFVAPKIPIDLPQAAAKTAAANKPLTFTKSPISTKPQLVKNSTAISKSPHVLNIPQVATKSSTISRPRTFSIYPNPNPPTTASKLRESKYPPPQAVSISQAFLNSLTNLKPLSVSKNYSTSCSVTTPRTAAVKALLARNKDPIVAKPQEANNDRSVMMTPIVTKLQISSGPQLFHRSSSLSQPQVPKAQVISRPQTLTKPLRESILQSETKTSAVANKLATMNKYQSPTKGKPNLEAQHSTLFQVDDKPQTSSKKITSNLATPKIPPSSTKWSTKPMKNLTTMIKARPEISSMEVIVGHTILKPKSSIKLQSEAMGKALISPTLRNIETRPPIRAKNRLTRQSEGTLNFLPSLLSEVTENKPPLPTVSIPSSDVQIIKAIPSINKMESSKSLIGSRSVAAWLAASMTNQQMRSINRAVNKKQEKVKKVNSKAQSMPYLTVNTAIRKLLIPTAKPKLRPNKTNVQRRSMGKVKPRKAAGQCKKPLCGKELQGCSHGHAKQNLLAGRDKVSEPQSKEDLHGVHAKKSNVKTRVVNSQNGIKGKAVKHAKAMDSPGLKGKKQQKIVKAQKTRRA